MPRSSRPHPCLPLLLGLSTAFSGTGCRAGSPLYRPVRASDMRDAASVSVSVLSVAPWSEYARALQPNFDLSTDDAVHASVPDSRWVNEARQRQARLGKETVVLDEGSSGVQPKSVPSLLFPQNGPVGGPVGPVELPIDAQNGAQDPVLRFTAATALYQEVQMLNRYIRDAAIPNGFRPYMVRLQVSLMPNRRHAPYDAYTTLSFFVPGNRLGLERAVPLSTQDEIFQEPFGNAPKVLPVVVTDNLEATVQSRSLERVFSLLYTLAEFPGSAIIDKMDSGIVENAIMDEVHGRDLNSLFSVSRLSENTLRIRMGAMQQATADYAMIPRNHHVTLLLMVPEGSPPLMEVVSKTELVDTDTGRVLPAGDARGTNRMLAEVGDRWGLDALGEEGLLALLAHAEANDQAGFSGRLWGMLPASHRARASERALWMELIALTVGEEYTASLFELPEQEEDMEESTRIFEQQIVVAEDVRGAGAMGITLREARVPEFERILAVLTLTGGGLGDVVLPATRVSVDSGKRVLHLEFPSLERLQLTEGLLEPPLPGEEEQARRAELRLSWAGEEHGFEVLYRTLEPSEPVYAEPVQVPTARYRWNPTAYN